MKMWPITKAEVKKRLVEIRKLPLKERSSARLLLIEEMEVRGVKWQEDKD